MTKQIYMLPVLACLLILAAGVPSIADEVMGENSQKCISTRTLTGTRIVDDQNVLFFRTGKTVYHNVLPKQCKGLAHYGMFSYGTLAGSICERDTIRIVDSNNNMPGRACTLGYFYKITKEDIPAIYERRYRPVEPKPVSPAEPEDVTEKIEEPPDSTPN